MELNHLIYVQPSVFYPATYVSFTTALSQCFCGICLEPYRKGSDWLRAAGCQGDGVFSPEKVCAQRSRSTQLHVSHRDVQRNQQFIHCHWA